jgi:hypothetical protein
VHLRPIASAKILLAVRFGRIILASLTAFAAYSYAQATPRPANTNESLRLFQAVVPMLVHAADSAASAPAVNSPAHAVLTLDALTTTPLAGALCLIALAIDLIARRHQRTFLRC